MDDLSTKLTCSIDGAHQNRCRLTASEAAEEDAVAVLRMIASSLSLLGSAAIIFLVLAKRQLKNSKVHPIFALAVTDVILFILWFLGGSAWLRRVDNRVLCFVISLPTVIFECVSVNLTLVYALLAYAGIRNRNPETLLLQRPDNETTQSAWTPRATAMAYLVALMLPAGIVTIVFIAMIIFSDYKVVMQVNECTCWCLPTLGNVLPLAISTDDPTASYIRYISALETMYGAVIGTNYLVVFVLLVIVYSKCLAYIKKMREQVANSRTLCAYSAVHLLEEGHVQARKSVLAFIIVFIISGLCNFILAYTILSLEINSFANYGVHRTTPERYHNSRSRSIMKLLIALLYLQALTVPLQGFLNAIVYAWTKEDFLQVMGVSNAALQEQDDEEVDENTTGNNEDWEDNHSQSSMSSSYASIPAAH